MTYLYEQLGAERFQELCQAVLTLDKPRIQCLPTGQPDGGRDAMSRAIQIHDIADTAIFQVKFSKNSSAKDERDVVEEIIKQRLRKYVSWLNQDVPLMH